MDIISEENKDGFSQACSVEESHDSDYNDVNEPQRRPHSNESRRIRIRPASKQRNVNYISPMPHPTSHKSLDRRRSVSRQMLEPDESPFTMADFIGDSTPKFGLVWLEYWKLKLAYTIEVRCMTGWRKILLLAFFGVFTPITLFGVLITIIVWLDSPRNDCVYPDNPPSWMDDFTTYFENASSTSIRRILSPEFILERETQLCSGIFSCGWLTWEYIMDSAWHLDQFGDDSLFSLGFILLLVSLCVTCYGIVALAIFSGIAIESVISTLRMVAEGSTHVVEEGHHLICGWGFRAPFVMQQLSLSMASDGGGTIVVLTTYQKSFIDKRIQDMRNDDLLSPGTRVIVRTGNLTLPHDLFRAAAMTAKNIIILANTRNPTVSDARALRSLVTIEALSFRRPRHTSVIVELCNLDTRNSLQAGIWKSQVKLEHMVVNDSIARLQIKCLRTPRLSCVFERLLGFDGDEFYFISPQQLVGKRFSEILLYFPDATVIGYMCGRQTFLNPGSHYIFQESHQLIVIAEDDSAITVLKEPFHIQKDLKLLPFMEPPARVSENILICGWRRDIQDLLFGLDFQAPPGSTVTLFCDKPVKERKRELSKAGFMTDEDMATECMKNTTVFHHVGDACLTRHILQLRSPMPNINEMTHILILADENDKSDTMLSDSHCLSTLLAMVDVMEIPEFVELIGKQKLADVSRRGLGSLDLDSVLAEARELSVQRSQTLESCRSIASKVTTPHILIEILNPSTQVMINNNEDLKYRYDWSFANDFIAKVLGMVGEQIELNRVIEGLLDLNGQNINIRNATQFVNPGETSHFFTIMQRAQRQDELAIGYFKHNVLCEDRIDPIINPHNKTEPMRWSDQDRVITLSGGNSPMKVRRQMRPRKVGSPMQKAMDEDMHSISETKDGYKDSHTAVNSFTPVSRPHVKYAQVAPEGHEWIEREEASSDGSSREMPAIRVSSEEPSTRMIETFSSFSDL